MSEALVPAAAAPVVVADGEADVVLPALIVDTGPDACLTCLSTQPSRRRLERPGRWSPGAVGATAGPGTRGPRRRA